MLRVYESGKTENVKYFTGIEIENTAFKGQKTLFVDSVDLMSDYQDIVTYSKIHGCTHIYLGANHCFQNLYVLSAQNSEAIKKLVSDSFNVTLDVSTICELDYLEDLFSSPKFNLTISIKLPKIKRYKNLAIKLDDSDFNDTNEGVWVQPIEHIMSKDTFTPWHMYSSDKIL